MLYYYQVKGEMIMYIIYDIKKKLYRNFIGEDETELWLRFVKYMSDKGIHDAYGFTTVKITEQEHRLIEKWFEEEHLMNSVDEFIINQLKVEEHLKEWRMENE